MAAILRRYQAHEAADRALSSPPLSSSYSAAPWPVLELLWPTVQLFLRLETQWRIQPLTGRVQGLRYDQVELVARWSGYVLDAESFAWLQVMEREAVQRLNVK